MKRRTVWLIRLLIIFVVVSGTRAVKYLPNMVAYRQSSEVYKRYCEVEGIRATYVKDYRVNDTLTIGVTLLQATDSAGWEYLLQEFNIPEDMKMLSAICDIFEWQAKRESPETRVTITKDDCDTCLTADDIVLCAISFKNHEICFFHTQDKSEVTAVENYNFDNMINKKDLINNKS